MLQLKHGFDSDAKSNLAMTVSVTHAAAHTQTQHVDIKCWVHCNPPLPWGVLQNSAGNVHVTVISRAAEFSWLHWVVVGGGQHWGKGQDGQARLSVFTPYCLTLCAGPEDGSMSRPLTSSILASTQQLRTARSIGYPERTASGHFFEVTFLQTLHSLVTRLAGAVQISTHLALDSACTICIAHTAKPDTGPFQVHAAVHDGFW